MFTERLTIGLIGPFPPPSGGMATQTAQLSRLLEGEGASVYLVQTNRPYAPRWAGNLKGIRAVFRLFPYLKDLWVTAGKVDLFHIMANSGWSWHLFAAPAIRIAAFRKVPVVVNYRGGEAEQFFNRSFRWVKPNLDRCDAIVVPSSFLKQVFEKWGVPVTVVPNIIDLERFSRGQEKVGSVDQRPLHLAVTRNLEKIYDVGTAIEAFSQFRQQFPDARLSIAGEGEERASLMRLCQQLGVDEAVEFTGRLGHDEISDLYRSADILLNPSLADNMPNSLLEAMASGVPIVSTDVGGIPYLVQDGVTALLVPPGRPKKMAAAAERLVRNSALRAKMIASGQALVKQFEWENVGEHWSTVYDAIRDR